jgi:NADH dehydrogenase
MNKLERILDDADDGTVRAVADLGGLRLTGAPPWVFGLVVHLIFLTGFKNRVAAPMNWTSAFLGRRWRQRTITIQLVVAPNVLATAALTHGAQDAERVGVP